MERFDEKLKERARREPFPLPEDYAGRVFGTCAALEETDRKTGRGHRSWRRWAGCAAAAVALFVAVPNLSPAAAAAMAELPVLGALVEIVTFRDYTYGDDHSSAEIRVPELGGSAAAEETDRQIQAYTDALIQRFWQEREAAGGGYQGLDVSSQVVTDTDRWFTLRVDAEETQASSYGFSRFYHIDKTTGAVVTLADLFREDADYVTALSGEVLRQMEQQALDGEADYFPEAFTAVAPDQGFYWDADGGLVLVFDEYAVAPGSMGMPEFHIPAEVYEDLLA